jgi:hypothetical protein
MSDVEYWYGELSKATTYYESVVNGIVESLAEENGVCTILQTNNAVNTVRLALNTSADLSYHH